MAGRNIKPNGGLLEENFGRLEERSYIHKLNPEI
jgi:hypothetical protein